MKKKSTLIISIALPLVIGGAAALITGGAFKDFQNVTQPPLSPPAWLFPVVWTILYILMGISCYLYIKNGGAKDKGLYFYGISLLFNFLWPILFFSGKMYLTALIVLALLWICIFLTINEYLKRTTVAGYLQIPYLIWSTFAFYLNLSIWILNK